MADNQRRILEMLKENKISLDEAERLLSLMGRGADSDSTRAQGVAGKTAHKYLRIVVTPREDSGSEAEHVNIRVPIGLIRAGMKFTAFLPRDKAELVNDALRNRGVDFDLRNLKDEDIDELIAALDELEVDVHNGKGKVKVYLE